MSTPMQSEPALTAATITAAVGAILAVLISFGIPLTDDQEKAILTVAVIAAPFVVGLVTRSYAFAPANVVAYQTGSGLVVAGDAAPVPTGVPVAVETTTQTPEFDEAPEVEADADFPEYDERG